MIGLLDSGFILMCYQIYCGKKSGSVSGFMLQLEGSFKIANQSMSKFK